MDMGRRRAAAAADDVDEAGVGEFAQHRRHEFGAFVVEPEFIGQAGIGIGADQRVGDAGEIGDVGAHLLGAQRTIQADRKRRRMLHRDPERLRRLAGQHASGQIRNGAGHHDGNACAALGEDFRDGIERRLGVERVEHGLHQEKIGAAVEEAAGLLAIGKPQLVEAYGAKARIGDVGRDRGGAIGRTHCAGDKARAAILARRNSRRLLGEPGAGDVELGDQRFRPVIRLGDAGR